MNEKSQIQTARTVDAFAPRCIVPFTGGVILSVYAFFWPESYGCWLGTIVRAFRAAAGF